MNPRGRSLTQDSLYIYSWRLETIGVLAPTTEVVMAVLLFLAAVAAAVVDEGFWGGDGHGVEWLLGKF